MHIHRPYAPINTLLPLLLLLLPLAACSQQSETTCASLETATAYVADCLEQFATIMERENSPQIAMTHMLNFNHTRQQQINACSQRISESFQKMSPQQIFQYHQTFISSPKVRRFLDAQDQFNEKATPELIQTLDDMLSPLFLLSE